MDRKHNKNKEKTRGKKKRPEIQTVKMRICESLALPVSQVCLVVGMPSIKIVLSCLGVGSKKAWGESVRAGGLFNLNHLMRMVIIIYTTLGGASPK